ncbi:hypothetical protein C8R43DRAFT_1132468 [Mycena crocata]|nr:hypothetical protein C8R43DRAFT_1132468 [Mycena crocata]
MVQSLLRGLLPALTVPPLHKSAHEALFPPASTPASTPSTAMKFSTSVSLAVVLGLATIASAAPAPGFTIHTDIIVHDDQEKIPGSAYAVGSHLPILTLADISQASSLVEEASVGTAQCRNYRDPCSSWDPCCSGLNCVRIQPTVTPFLPSKIPLINGISGAHLCVKFQAALSEISGELQASLIMALDLFPSTLQ